MFGFGRSPRKKEEVRSEILDRLIRGRYSKQDNTSLSKTEIVGWFGKHEQEIAEQELEFLLDRDAPVEYADEEKRTLWIVDFDDARRYRASSLDYPRWFEE